MAILAWGCMWVFLDRGTEIIGSSQQVSARVGRTFQISDGCMDHPDHLLQHAASVFDQLTANNNNNNSYILLLLQNVLASYQVQRTVFYIY